MSSEAKAPRVLVVATARPTFAVDVAEQRAGEAKALLESLGAEVFGPEGLVMTPEDVEAAKFYLAQPRDLLINVCASFSDASPALELYGGLDQPVLLWSFREPGPVGDRLWLNSMCGANLFAHALTVHLKGEGRLIYGDPSEPKVAEVLTEALRGRLPERVTLPTEQRERGSADVVEAGLAALGGRRVGLVGEAPTGFTPSLFDGELIEKLFGVVIEEISVDGMFGRIRGVDAGVRDAEKAAAAAAQPSVESLDSEVRTKSAAVTTAMRDWRDQGDLSAMAIRCWPEFATDLGVCPCSSLSRVADEGTPTACERDVYGALTMMLLESLGSGTTYLVDTVELETDANLVRLWHCGAAATSLAQDPSDATQYVHCNRKIGVAGNFPLRTGPVIMARLTEDPERGGLRLLIASGESMPEPNRFQGNTAAVRMDCDATQFVHGLVDGGFPHHTVLAWSDVRPALRAAADRLDIPVVEW